MKHTISHFEDYFKVCDKPIIQKYILKYSQEDYVLTYKV